MCNSKGELQWHILSQHTEDKSFVDAMLQLWELTENNLYPAKHIKALENFNVMQDLECIKKLGSNLKLCKKKVSRKFLYWWVKLFCVK